MLTKISIQAITINQLFLRDKNPRTNTINKICSLPGAEKGGRAISLIVSYGNAHIEVCKLRFLNKFCRNLFKFYCSFFKDILLNHTYYPHSARKNLSANMLAKKMFIYLKFQNCLTLKKV